MGGGGAGGCFSFIPRWVWEVASVELLTEFEMHFLPLGSREPACGWQRVQGQCEDRVTLLVDRGCVRVHGGPCGKEILPRVGKMEGLLIARVHIEWAAVKVTDAGRAAVYVVLSEGHLQGAQETPREKVSKLNAFPRRSPDQITMVPATVCALYLKPLTFWAQPGRILSLAY